ncbi:MAG: oxalyl-CoA decarboxylase [Actinomycetia bacterium]|nr:oxalyl-CoA decarboxylase [Actinomycetes bacterium]
MAEISGARILARNLKQQGVEYVFGIVGFPVVPVAYALQKEGITFIGMRNEQSASYAAQAAGYLTGRPQGCLVVSGPGVIHALAGLANAKENLWPMILIGGASPTDQNGMGAFQEEDQVAAAKMWCKYAHRVESHDRIPYYVEQAIRTSLFGRPGPVYLDMPADIIDGRVDEETIGTAPTVGEPPRTHAEPDSVRKAIAALKGAEKPLAIVGKGMAWSRAEDEVRQFIDRTQVPFLASPMGKGVVPDDHPLSVGAARSHALQEADVILLAGARLNWIMHFGAKPRLNPNVKVLQLDSYPEQIGHNVPAEVALVGDGKAIMGQLNAELADDPWRYEAETAWRTSIAEKIAANEEAVAGMKADESAPMNYYRAFRDIADWLKPDDLIVGEGANTMDIGRTQMPNIEPRHRLDAGSYGTMGIGLGFAVAAAVCNPGKRVVSVQGDSAFGFSGMEMETICRHQLRVIVVILNNNGIGGGVAELPEDGPPPPSVYLPTARYEKIAEAFGAGSFHVEDPADLRAALDNAAALEGPAIVHVRLDPKAGRKPQVHGWLTR